MAGEAMIENVNPRPRFARGMRGYDRTQVDAYIADSVRWAAQAWDRIVQLETRNSELEAGEAPRLVREDADRTVEAARSRIDRFVGEVDAKAAELHGAVVDGARPRIDELRQQVEELEDQRQSTLGELMQLRQSLNGLAKDVYGIDVAGGGGQLKTVERPKAAETSPTEGGEAPDGGDAEVGAERSEPDAR